MAIFFTSSTSNTTGMSFSFGMPVPAPAPPYKGSYLPAVIHVFDYEVDLEQLGVVDLQRRVAEAAKETHRIGSASQRACMSLEPDFKDEITDIRELQNQLYLVQQKVHGLEQKLITPSLPDVQQETPQEDTDDQDLDEDDETVPEDLASDHDEDGPSDFFIDDEGDPDKAEAIKQIRRKQKAELARLRRTNLKFKRASKAVLGVYRRIMRLIHPTLNTPDEYTEELHALADQARINNDLAALKGILSAAKTYRSPQGKLALKNFLKQKQQALKEQLTAFRNELSMAARNPAFQIHVALEKGDKDTAKALFSQILSMQRQSVLQAIMNAEMRHTGLTGTFSDGSTTKTFAR